VDINSEILMLLYDLRDKGSEKTIRSIERVSKGATKIVKHMDCLCLCVLHKTRAYRGFACGEVSKLTHEGGNERTCPWLSM
jgi:hypothetical protein